MSAGIRWLPRAVLQLNGFLSIYHEIEWSLLIGRWHPLATASGSAVECFLRIDRSISWLGRGIALCNPAAPLCLRIPKNLTAVGSSRYTKGIRVTYRRLHKASTVSGKRLPKTTPRHRMQVKFALIVIVVAITLPLIIGKVTIAANNQPTPTEIYAKHCASCHGKDGRARTFKAKFNHARDLTDPLWQDEVSDERLFNSIMNGKKKMPAYRKKLSEGQVNSLIAYVRTRAR